MAVNRFSTNNDIINRVAVETGLAPVTDAFASTDANFRQLRYLLTTCVQELMELHPWQILIREYQYTTGVGETGKLDLPTDFAYMIDQTGWERSENIPLIGPLTAQDWTYLLGRDLVGSTIYASFRFDQNQLWIFPQNPMPTGLEINFEYISRNLIEVAGSDPTEYTDEAEQAADIPQFPPNLIKSFLKVKWLEAKSLDSTAARNDFYRVFNSWAGKDTGASIVSAGKRRPRYPYLDGFYNVPDTGYGV